VAALGGGLVDDQVVAGRVVEQPEGPPLAVVDVQQPAAVDVVKIQAGNPAVHGGEERDTLRNSAG
jgi:hypothetical protein